MSMLVPPPPIAGPVHIPPPDDREPKVRPKAVLWDRIKIVVLLSGYILLAAAYLHSQIPIMSFWEALKDQRVDIHSADEGEAPIAAQHRDEPMQVTQPYRVIEPEFRAQRRSDLGRHIGVGGQLAKRIPRGERQDSKQHDADAEETRHDDQ